MRDDSVGPVVSPNMGEHRVTPSGIPFHQQMEFSISSRDMPPPIPSELWSAIEDSLQHLAHLVAELTASGCEATLSMILKPVTTHVTPEHTLG